MMKPIRAETTILLLAAAITACRKDKDVEPETLEPALKSVETQNKYQIVNNYF